ncbi:MAG: phospholipase D-like domain-containing protein [Coxiellaceae bacterium]|jgi:cardiolipin synthase|nr:phospholipase D-like domain-containing protein [Coxiellaceae bacterium]
MVPNSQLVAGGEKVFFAGQDYFTTLLADLKAAKESIELETYIFDLDSLGQRILEVLTEAVKRKVAVRILVDGAGTPQWNGIFVKNLERAGAETRVFHPFPWRLWQWSRSRVRISSLLKAIYLFLKINTRNHRKVCVIDKTIVYVGSFNISQNHLDKNHNGKAWRDTGVRLSHVDLRDILQAFESVWTYRPIQERIRHFFHHIRTNPVIRLNNTWYRRRILYKNLLNRIRDCNYRIWITNAYFIPDNFLLRRLIDAAHAGVDVRILLPQESDVSFMPWASQAFYESLLKAGIRIFEYVPSVLHAKTLILDDWMMIGSSNLNSRSLLHDLEVDVNIRSSESKLSLEQQFLIDLKHSKEIHLEDWQKRSWYQRIVGWGLLYLKYLI